jgi:transcriptional regulator with XRE-family HTH domain
VLRKRHGISAYAVAQAIGVTPPAIYQWEAGRRKIHPAMARLLTLYFEGKLPPTGPHGSPKRR